jgi:hypothetical protein
MWVPHETVSDVLDAIDIGAEIAALREEQRQALTAISAQPAEVNLRLRIQRDPRHTMTIVGQRLVQKDAAIKPATGPAGARKPKPHQQEPSRVKTAIGPEGMLKGTAGEGRARRTKDHPNNHYPRILTQRCASLTRISQTG